MVQLITLLLAFGLAAPLHVPHTALDSNKHRPPTHTTMTVAEVLRKHTDEWMQIEGVTGTGEGKTKDGIPCITVFVDHKTPTIRKKIPSSIDGYKVKIEATGKIEARPRGLK